MQIPNAQSVRAGSKFLTAAPTLTYTTLASLKVVAGAYLIQAKTVIADDVDTSSVFVHCKLVVDNPSDEDQAMTMVGPGSAREVVSLLLPHTFTSDGTITLQCAPSNPTTTSHVNTELTWLTAMRIESETH
jgi:hypothetical protein